MMLQPTENKKISISFSVGFKTEFYVISHTQSFWTARKFILMKIEKRKALSFKSNKKINTKLITLICEQYMFY